jgi:hypothetical protein
VTVPASWGSRSERFFTAGLEAWAGLLALRVALVTGAIWNPWLNIGALC